MAKSATAASPYHVHPAVKMVAKWVAELPEKTGRSLDEWIAFVEAKGPKEAAARRDWLKKEHGFGTNAASWIAGRADGRGWEDGDPKRYLKAAAGHVEAMYAGKKAALKPIHDRLLATGRALGKDVRVCPCTTIVPLYRSHVFAQIKPTTLTRIDFGLALGATKATGRLIDTGGFAKKDRITHRLAITSLADVDAEVKRWLKVAYDMDA